MWVYRWGIVWEGAYGCGVSRGVGIGVRGVW